MPITIDREGLMTDSWTKQVDALEVALNSVRERLESTEHTGRRECSLRPNVCAGTNRGNGAAHSGYVGRRLTNRQVFDSTVWVKYIITKGSLAHRIWRDVLRLAL